MFRKLKDKLKKMTPGLELELAKYILITAIGAVGLFLAVQIPLIRATLSQEWSISIFNFLLIVLLAAVAGSSLTYIPLRKKLKILISSAEIDKLTGVLSDEILKPKLEKEIENATTNKKALSIILIDIDDFKRINDIYGHSKADSVIEQFAKTLKDDIRNSSKDVLFRYHGHGHGDEFLIIAPGTEGANARIFAERLRKTIQGSDFQIDNNYEKLTMSAGVAELNNESEAITDFLSRADKALLEAKKQKNRTFLTPKKN